MKGDDNKSLSYSEGYNEQKDYRVDPADFSTLQTGGPRGQCKVGFIFWQSGRVLNNGNVFVRSTIEQECRRVCGAKLVRHCPKVPTIGKGSISGNTGFCCLAIISVSSRSCCRWHSRSRDSSSFLRTAISSSAISTTFFTVVQHPLLLYVERGSGYFLCLPGASPRHFESSVFRETAQGTKVSESRHLAGCRSRLLCDLHRHDALVSIPSFRL